MGQNGRPADRDLEFWLQAESEIRPNLSIILASVLLLVTAFALGTPDHNSRQGALVVLA
ncbi:DUF2934 domain-containing protein [Bradyrhizobium sp. CSA112]|uniref:DUF2934 domain-containing protein n=1 Tax=Bradyrhizobium sp. CSA112 TaxID=2699170 RepID=UPI0023AF96FE|nr:DUF2934 domain-containing protein [Bradyrhizobium sp. CSA112]